MIIHTEYLCPACQAGGTVPLYHYTERTGPCVHVAHGCEHVAGVDPGRAVPVDPAAACRGAAAPLARCPWPGVAWLVSRWPGCVPRHRWPWANAGCASSLMIA